MYRHVKNLDELILFAGLSCGLAFLVRLEPAFFFPVLLLRIGFLIYCAYVVGMIEENRVTASLLAGACFIGLLGGNWDWIEIWIRYNERIIGFYFQSFLFVIAIVFICFFLWNRVNGKSTGK